ncbi:MAG TPA: CDP-archaeol synthase [Candidatus Saccharimonadia bacterium]|nr:CDP-archaeol synthase [Candidatus Saccharimonadia bacterium]
MHIIRELFFALWFFLPAGIANMMPIFAAHVVWLKRYSTPMDFGKSYHGKRIFGAHKTWRGLLVGAIFATITLGLQQLAIIHISWFRDWTSQVDYTHLPTVLVGPLFAIGALGGDAIESFFKRQRNIAPGHGWFPFDQIDYIIGGAIATTPFVQLSLFEYAWLVVLWLIVHLIASAIGYLIGVKERPI